MEPAAFSHGLARPFAADNSPLPAAPIVRPQPAGSSRGLAGNRAGYCVNNASGFAMPPPTRPPSPGGDGRQSATHNHSGRPPADPQTCAMRFPGTSYRDADAEETTLARRKPSNCDRRDGSYLSRYAARQTAAG